MATIDATAGSTVTPSLATLLPCNAHQLGPYYAGEDLPAGSPCYIKASDGLVYKSNGTAATAPAAVHGWTALAYRQGQAATLWHGVLLAYGPSSLTPGTKLYVSATAGKVDDAATTGGTAPVAEVCAPPANITSPTHGFVFVHRSSY
jgi:hypothetical protein